MKKIKTISVRLSAKDYEILKKDYKWHKEDPLFTELCYHVEIKTFSDYIRHTLTKGMNE